MNAVIRVLLCDDEPLVRAGLALLLRSTGAFDVVAEVGDGFAAVEETRRLLPDVVVLDVRIPGIDGVEATRRIVEERAGSSGGPRVLLLTTFHVNDAVHGALRAGASGFLLKDAAPDELTQAIRAVANGDAWLAPAVTRELVAEFAARPVAAPAPPPGLELLTPRELEVLLLVAHGLSNTEIARRLYVGESTVKTHVSRLVAKLGVRDRLQAAASAYRAGLIAPGGDSAPPP